MQEIKNTINVSPPSGTRDFLPDELLRREAAFQKVRDVFGRYGFQPTQTPAFERLEVLTGKYGDEGDKLIFKIQKRGERADEGADMALRYDQTVPLARIVAKYRGKIPKIFRRYQIGPVWRADRPGKGRFREFWQCDVDVVGAKPPMADAEVILVLAEALAALGLRDFEVRLNSRRVLTGLMESCGIPEGQRPATLTAIDKLDKIGVSGVVEELLQRDIPKAGINTLTTLMMPSFSKTEWEVASLLRDSGVGKEGVEEVAAIRNLVQPLLKVGQVRFTPTLSRGLDYYTGMIFEIYAENFPGAIAAGGRYDNLLAMFTKDSIPACGGSIGIERVLDLLAQRGSDKPAPPAQVLMTVWGEVLRPAALRMAAEIRARGIAVETYLGSEGIGKQVGYASSRGIRCVVIQGPDERALGQVAVKDLVAENQTLLPEDGLAQYLLGIVG